MKKQLTLSIPVQLRIILVAPPAGVDFGIQDGKGHGYSTIQIQNSTGSDLRFEFSVMAKINPDDEAPNFVGSVVQGPPKGRFIYINIGKSAGQINSCWNRRLKIQLAGITRPMIESLEGASGRFLQASIPGTGKDGGPSCATVKPIAGWQA